MAKGLDDLEKSLIYLKGNLAKEIAKDIKPKFEKIVADAIRKFYMEYTPKKYARTYNFSRISGSAEVYGLNSQALYFQVNSELMSPYIEYLEDGTRQVTEPSAVYVSSFIHGFHGEVGAVGISPYDRVTRNIQLGFNNGFSKSINNVLKKFL